MKVSKKTIIITSIITLLPIVFGLVMWDKLPDPMPTHFGVDGVADGWSPKSFGVFGLPLIMLAVHLIFIFASKSDPKSKNYSEKLFTLIIWLIPVLSIFAGGMTYAYALGYTMNTTKYVMMFVAVLFIVIGNYLPKCRHNYTMGVKLPWTLADENNWNATHRVAGYTWILGGIVLLVNAFFFNMVVFFVVVLAMVLIPTVYSYMYYRKHEVVKKEEE